MVSIGIDIGTQSLKAIVVDAHRICARALSAYALQFPKPGWAQQDPSDWERALALVIPLVLQRAGIGKEEVDSIAISGQLDGCVAVNDAGEAISPCLVWMDRRSNDVLPRLSPAEHAAWREATGQVMDASHMAAKISWFKREGIAVGSRFHQPTSYLVQRLCQRQVFDPALASTTMLCKLETGHYDSSLLELFSIEESELPEIAPAESIAAGLSAQWAERLGLVAGTPVAVGTGDDFATLWGAGLQSDGTLIVMLGTAEVVGMRSDVLQIDSQALVETHRFSDGFFLENPGWLSGGALRWIRRILGIDSDAQLDALAAKAPPGCEGVSFLPALSGAMAPQWNANARGCFYGLTSKHGPEHMARAVLEGCSFAMRDVLERFVAMQLSVRSILLVGGGAASGLWSQMRADLCQLPVKANVQDDSSALGAALLGRAMAQGRSAAEVSLGWQQKRTAYFPNDKVATAYEEAYQRYRELFFALEPLFKDR